jgi:hypothetical protein
MSVTIPVFESWSWPWGGPTLHIAYLLSGLLIALHYVPQLRRAWRHPQATLTAQSLSTWSVWTACRGVALAYGVFVIHDLVFLLVVGADLLGRMAMVGVILRAHAVVAVTHCPNGARPCRLLPASISRRVLLPRDVRKEEPA